ncbi:signal peptidase I [Dietzia aurantiaca]|nr:signal peptidase I [Dietzia aurantiaca]
MWWVRTTGGWLLFIACGFILLALVVVPRATGAQAYTVLTGSMEPRIAPGALVVVRPTAPENLAAGDVITFQPYSGDPSVVTHRITDIYYDMSGQRRIYTRGDANNVADDWALVPEQIRGKLWYSVPQLGRVNVLLTGKTRAVAITIVAGSLIVYAAWVFGSGVRDRSREKQSALIVDRARSDEDAQVSHGAVVGNDEQQEGAGHDDSA